MKHLHFILLLVLSTSISAQITVTTITQPFKGSGGLSLDADGNLYIADFGDMLGGADPDGIPNNVMRLDPSLNLTVFSADFTGASGNAFDTNGILHQSDIRDNGIYRIVNGARELVTNDGIVAPVGIAFDSMGNLYVCNCGNSTIRKITPGGVSTQFSSGSVFACPNGMTIDTNDNLYVVNFSNTNVVKITPDGTPEVIANTTAGNGHVDYDPIRNRLYIASYGGNQIFFVTLDDNLIFLLAGTGVRGNDDGNALEATFSTPNGIAVSENGDELYVNCAEPLSGAIINPQLVRKISGLNSLSVSENEGFLSDVKTFPNPASSEITIQFNTLLEDSIFTLEILDLQGRVLLKKEGLETFGNTFFETITLDNFATGHYIYTLSTGKIQVYSNKFVKL